ncbi:unnamed protein product, partial [Rotaria sordida]
MVINDAIGYVENFTEAQRRCRECELMETGGCRTIVDECICYPNFTGDFCRTRVTTSTNWTVIVAVISAIAGLLLIISLSIC